MEIARTRQNAASKNGAPVKTITDLEEELLDLKEFNQRLESVIQGNFDLEMPEWAHNPYRNGRVPYDPDIDDGVRVSLLPIQEAGLLPVKKVI